MLLVILYVNFGSDKRGKPILLVICEFSETCRWSSRTWETDGACWLFLRPCGMATSRLYDLVWKGHSPTEAVQSYRSFWIDDELCGTVTFWFYVCHVLAMSLWLFSFGVFLFFLFHFFHKCATTLIFLKLFQSIPTSVLSKERAEW